VKTISLAVPNLVDLYSRPYDAAMIQWRLLGASDKADHIEAMCRSLGSIETILDVGCGTGAVLEQMATRRVGSRFAGIEIGSERPKAPITGDHADKILIAGYDGKAIPYEDNSFDLAYATHVLEHVVDEREFLHELRRVARRYVYVEVPCELNLRTSYHSLQSTLSIGHINSYTFQSFVLTLETSGLHVIKLDIFDHSYGVYRFMSSWWKAAAKMALRRSLLAINKRLASHIFTYHVGALCQKAPRLNIN
jgi:SAM-dependent methyltransferase